MMMMHSAWSDDKFLTGSVGHKMRLHFLNKSRITDLLPTQLASYRHVLAREFEYQL